MGSTISAQKTPDSDSAMKFRFFKGSSEPKKSLLSSPTKEKQFNNNQNPVSQFGSKEETFFDSQAWLESDCEDDFQSVNGDFTPARCSTSSNHRISFTASPQPSQSHFMDRKVDLSTETSPTEKKKKLSQLLQESLGGDEDDVDPKTINSNQEAKPTNVVVFSRSTNGTPQLSKSNSIRNSERTPNRYFKSEKEKSGKTLQCCLPSLVTSLSFSERKKRSSPGRNGGGQ